MNSRYTLTIALLSIATGSFAQKGSELVPAPSVPASVLASNLPVAFVEIARIMTPNVTEAEVHEWRDEAKALQTELEAKNAKIEAEQKEYQKAKAELDNPSNSKWTTEESRDSKTQALAVKEAEITSEIKNLQKYYSRAVQKLQMDMHENIKKASKDLRVQKKLGAVLPADIALDVDPKANITQDVIDLLNREYEAKKKAEKKSPLPALPSGLEKPAAKS